MVPHQDLSGTVTVVVTYVCNLRFSAFPLEEVVIWVANTSQTCWALGIHVIKVFPHNGLVHVTEKTFIEDTIYKIIFQPEQFQAICITSGPKGGL